MKLGIINASITIGLEIIPLILAWALTIHKCQGATLDVAEIDIGSGIFECGQTYVALSRVRSLDGLYLNSFDPTRIKISRKVKNYYDDRYTFSKYALCAPDSRDILKLQAVATDRPYC